MDEAPRTNLRTSRRLPWLVAIVALVAAGGYGVYRYFSRAPPPAPAAAPAPEAPAAAAEAPAPTAPDLSPAREEDAPALLGAASQNPLFKSWIAAGDLIRRWVVVTDNLAEGASPRKALPFLAPRGSFAVVERGGHLAVAPEAYARYDAFADAVGTVDARAVAVAYRRLHGVLEAAYRELGFPGGSLDRATARALHRIAGAPLATGDEAVEPHEAVYVYSSEKLEQLRQVEKHLLRMGPRNERILQAKARELLAALELPAVAAQRP